MIRYAVVKNRSPVHAVRSVLEKMLSRKLVDALLVAARNPYSLLPMPTLFCEPDKMEGVDPLAPVAPFNAARQAATVIKKPAGKRIALVLRPCEQRALIELAKLKQCSLENVILIGIECLGRLENQAFIQHASEISDFTSIFYKKPDMQAEVTRTCRLCEHFMPAGVDLTISLLGAPEGVVGIISETETGDTLITQLELAVADEPKSRAATAGKLHKERIAARDALFIATFAKINHIEKFQKLIATCLSCHSCRISCPVCYCKECVFLTDIFTHPPETLLRRAMKRGAVKMPTETTMFYLTRLAHMSHACVGCGHCSSVCPSNIPVADIFRTVAAQTQALFDYKPGRDISEPIPYLVFDEELPESSSEHPAVSRV